MGNRLPFILDTIIDTEKFAKDAIGPKQKPLTMR